MVAEVAPGSATALPASSLNLMSPRWSTAAKTRSSEVLSDSVTPITLRCRGVSRASGATRQHHWELKPGPWRGWQHLHRGQRLLEVRPVLLGGLDACGADGDIVGAREREVGALGLAQPREHLVEDVEVPVTLALRGHRHRPLTPPAHAAAAERRSSGAGPVGSTAIGQTQWAHLNDDARLLEEVDVDGGTAEEATGVEVQPRRAPCPGRKRLISMLLV